MENPQHIHVVSRASCFVVIKEPWLVYCEGLSSSTSCGFFREKDLAAFFNSTISMASVLLL